MLAVVEDPSLPDEAAIPMASSLNWEPKDDISILVKDIEGERKNRAMKIGQNYFSIHYGDALSSQLAELNEEERGELYNFLLTGFELMTKQRAVFNANARQDTIIRLSAHGTLVLLIVEGFGIVVGGLLQSVQPACVNHTCVEEGAQYFGVGCQTCFYEGRDYECAEAFYRNVRPRPCDAYAYTAECYANVSSLVGELIPQVAVNTTRNVVCEALLPLAFEIPAAAVLCTVGGVLIVDLGVMAWTNYKERQLGRYQSPAPLSLAIKTKVAILSDTIQFLEAVTLVEGSDEFSEEVHTLMNKSLWQRCKEAIFRR